MSDFHSDLAGSSPATRFMITEQELQVITNDIKNIRMNVAMLMKNLRQIEEYLENKIPKKENENG